MLKTCIVCGKEFETNRPNQVTCGKRCRRARMIERSRKYRQEHQKEKLICLSCGKEFKGNKGQKYCSRGCASKENIKNKKSVSESLCWTCIHAVPSPEQGTGCSWSRSVGKIPVEGSEYKEKITFPWDNNVRRKVVLKIITKCPKYQWDTKARRK
ncbi:MAG: hypothetical protein HFI72_07395 [Peptococcaceae bacterium]|jgi:hypothetical protein|nr:hypothetical protein [Peptococcaceae bacterium]